MRLFIAIDLPEEMKDKLYAVAKEFSMPGVSITRKETYHVTMQFLGERKEEDLDNIKSSLSEISAKKFRMQISGVSCFRPERINVIFAGITEGRGETEAIYSQVSSSFQAHGIPCEDEQEYTPHVTFLRVRRLKQESKATLLSLLEKHQRDDFGFADVSSISLKRSTPTREGYVHELLYKVDLSP